MTENGIDPINIAAHIYLSLQEIAAREVAAQDPCVLTIGKFAGGQTPNIIPEKAVLEGTIRYKNKETGDRIFERIQEISNLCAQSFRGKAAVTEIASAPPLINNDEMIHEFCDDIKQFIAPQQVMILPQGGMGSEDFASFSYRVPVAYLLLGAGTSQENEAYGKPMHNQCVVFNEDVLCLGSSIPFLHNCDAVLRLPIYLPATIWALLPKAAGARFGSHPSHRKGSGSRGRWLRWKRRFFPRWQNRSRPGAKALQLPCAGRAPATL